MKNIKPKEVLPKINKMEYVDLEIFSKDNFSVEYSDEILEAEGVKTIEL